MKNYYAILGVSRDESRTGIRAAYRRLARHMHPDHAGERTTRAFQDIVEAHSVLSDPERRREYHEQLLRDEEKERRVVRNSVDTGVARTARSMGLSIEILLTPEEAARGGPVRVDIPFHEVCRTCGGRGVNWPFRCFTCEGRGTQRRIQPIWIAIPQPIKAGAGRAIALEQCGFGNVRLRLRTLL